MLDDLKDFIDQELGECLTAEQLCEKYAEKFCYLKEQMHYCMKNLTKKSEDDG